jgi:hypothetical protein
MPVLPRHHNHHVQVQAAARPPAKTILKAQPMPVQVRRWQARKAMCARRVWQKKGGSGGAMVMLPPGQQVVQAGSAEGSVRHSNGWWRARAGAAGGENGADDMPMVVAYRMQQR